ncbi:NADP-dependent oxidoreductase domain-containing protein, partial [Suillus plorans]
GTSEWQYWVLGEEEVIIHIKAFYDVGINTFDAADIYSNGLSDVILGNAIKKLSLPRDEIVVMTKVYRVVGRTPSEDVGSCGFVALSDLTQQIAYFRIHQERLQLDYVDAVVFVPTRCSIKDRSDSHSVMFLILMQLQSRQCKVTPYPYLWHYAITNPLTTFISMQNHHNLVYREEEREIFPTLEMFGVGCVAWSMAQDIATAPIVGTTSLKHLQDLLGMCLVSKEQTSELSLIKVPSVSL